MLARYRRWLRISLVIALLAALFPTHGVSAAPTSTVSPANSRQQITSSGASPVQTATRPVMAFYYPWYEPSDWSYARMSDLPVPTYSGGDEAALRRHIQQADDAGIDALICTWYGPNEGRLNQRCQRLMQLVQESGRDLRVAIIPDQSAAFDPAMRTVEGLAGALDTLRREFMTSPVYFTFRGKPAVFWFNPPSLGDPTTWRHLRDRADPNRDQFWFGGTDNFGYMDAYDTLYYYDITWESAPGAAMASYAWRLDSFNASRGENRPFIGTVMPGYDDLRVRPDGHRRDRADGDYYRGTWQTVIDRDADAVVLTSFNEFFEGTHIEPSERYGDLYLRLTREGSDRYRGIHSPSPPPTEECRFFAETNQQVCGRFLAYWEAHGGLAVNGLPLSGERHERLEDDEDYVVQYFERVRLEWHPENAPPYDVLLGQFGRRILAGISGAPTAPVGPRDGYVHFDVTGHNVRPQFMAYWNANGGLAQFGYPLSEEFTEVLEDGKPYTVQYFERARFEWHPDNDPPYDVLLGQFGRRILAETQR